MNWPKKYPAITRWRKLLTLSLWSRASQHWLEIWQTLFYAVNVKVSTKLSLRTNCQKTLIFCQSFSQDQNFFLEMELPAQLNLHHLMACMYNAIWHPCFARVGVPENLAIYADWWTTVVCVSGGCKSDCTATIKSTYHQIIYHFHCFEYHIGYRNQNEKTVSNTFLIVSTKLENWINKLRLISFCSTPFNELENCQN